MQKSNLLAIASIVLLGSVIYKTCSVSTQPKLTHEEYILRHHPSYPYLSDSAWCAHRCFDTILVANYSFDHDGHHPDYLTQRYEFDTVAYAAHLSGEYVIHTRHKGVCNRHYRYDIVLRDTATDIDLTLQELTTDFWGAPLSVLERSISHGYENSPAPIPLGGRIYHAGTDYKLWADIIRETANSRTYCTNKRFTSTQISEFSVWEDKPIDHKMFVMKSRTDKPYATYRKSGNLIEIYYYPGNTFFMIDASTYDVVYRDYIH